MNAIRSFPVALSLVLVFSPPASAMISLSYLELQDAMEMGVEVRSRPAGPDGVWIEITFETKGTLKDYSPKERFSRVELHIKGSGKGENEQTPLLTAALREERPKPDRVAISFSAERDQLDKFEIWIVVGGGVFDGGAFVLKMEEFVDMEKLAQPKHQVGVAGELIANELRILREEEDALAWRQGDLLGRCTGQLGESGVQVVTHRDGSLPLEARLALLEERVESLAHVLCGCNETEHVGLDPQPFFDRGLGATQDGLERDPDGELAAHEDPPRQLLGDGAQLIGRRNPVHEAVPKCRLRIDGIAGQDHLEPATATDDAR